MRPQLLLLLALAACGTKDPAGSCADRVATLSQRLAKPRSVDEIRKTASPALRADLDAVLAESDESHRATLAAKRLEPLAAACPPLYSVFGGVASETGPASKGDYLRAEVPKAIEACACKASPEHVSGLLEAIFSDWK